MQSAMKILTLEGLEGLYCSSLQHEGKHRIQVLKPCLMGGCHMPERAFKNPDELLSVFCSKLQGMKTDTFVRHPKVQSQFKLNGVPYPC